MSDLIAAIFEGPWVGELPDRSTVAPGEERLVTQRDIENGYWRPVDQAEPEPEQPEPEPEPPGLVAIEGEAV